MPARKATETTTDTLTLVRAEPVTAESIAEMRLQQKELAARIKAAKAALPKKTPLESVLEKQSHGVTDKRARTYFSNLVRYRVKAGQQLDEAREAVLRMFTAWLTAESAQIAHETW